MPTTIISGRHGSRFAAQMSDLHRHAANHGPEVAAWAHRQREHWWTLESTRRWRRECTAAIRARID